MDDVKVKKGKVRVLI